MSISGTLLFTGVSPAFSALPIIPAVLLL